VVIQPQPNPKVLSTALAKMLEITTPHKHCSKRADLPSGRVYVDNCKSDGKLPRNVYELLAESVTTMAYATCYVGDMEAQDREKARTVSMYTQDQQSQIAIASRANSNTSSIDKDEKRQLQRDLLKLQCEELDICDGDNLRRVKQLKLEIDLLQSQVADIELQCIKKQEIVTALLQQETQVNTKQEQDSKLRR
jgi:hypothetical protein